MLITGHTLSRSEARLRNALEPAAPPLKPPQARSAQMPRRIIRASPPKRADSHTRLWPIESPASATRRPQAPLSAPSLLSSPTKQPSSPLPASPASSSLLNCWMPALPTPELRTAHGLKNLGGGWRLTEPSCPLAVGRWSSSPCIVADFSARDRWARKPNEEPTVGFPRVNPKAAARVYALQQSPSAVDVSRSPSRDGTRPRVPASRCESRH